MKKILVVFTGGTIGSRETEGTIGLREDKRYPLLEEYREKHPGKAEFETAEPVRILSENSCPAFWTKLLSFLKQTDLTGYDGVIVTHGTDTLPYTAAFLGYYFAKTPVPVLLVSSNYPLSDEKSNGPANFEAAVDFIREGRYKGVFVPYQNEKEESVSVFLATRLLEADGYEDRFTSFDGGRLGRIKRGRFVYEDRVENPPLSAFLRKSEQPDGFSPAGESLIVEGLPIAEDFPNVIKLRPYPGFVYETVKLSEGTKAVFHGTYHSGTLCVEGEGLDASLFVKNAMQAGIPVYFGPVKKKKTQYVSANTLLEAGGIPVYDCSEAAAYVKLLIGCGLQMQGDRLEAFMRETIYFEQIERK